VQVKLRGERADGKQVSVPEGTTQVSVPVPDSKGFDNSEVYRPSGEVVDGLEVWTPFEGPWTATGAMPLSKSWGRSFQLRLFGQRFR
jgi:hypothetical protein